MHVQKNPGILLRGHQLAQPAREWTDGHVLGNGNLGVVVWGDAENLKIGLSKHDVYNLDADNAHGNRSRYTFMEMRERFKREGRACLYDNPNRYQVSQTRQTPLSCGVLTLSVMFGVNYAEFTQTLCPAEGVIRVRVVPVDRRHCYGMRYPMVDIAFCVDSESNTLALQMACGDSVPEGMAAKTGWSYTWPQHIHDGYETAFSTQGETLGTFSAGLGKGGGFVATVRQQGARPVMDATRGSLQGFLCVPAGGTAEMRITVATERDKPSSCDAVDIFARTKAWWEAFWSRSMVWLSDDTLCDLWAMGLYALGAATRPDTSPPNLQGIWNMSERALWHGDFHFNTNAEQCQWAALPSGHPELSRALVRVLTEDWREKLRLLASEEYGVPGALAVPLGADWLGRALGGWFSTSSVSTTAWAALHVWEQYVFDPDEALLRDTVFPFLRECCALYDGIMIFENGCYHTDISSSPERAIDTPNGRYTLFGRNPAINVAVIGALYQAAAGAARLLGEDDAHWAHVAAHMPPLPEQDGVLIEMETGYFAEGPAPGVTKECHRHPSRLMAVFPAGQIHLGSAPETLALGIRSYYDFVADGMEKFTGWTYSYLACIAARLGLGREAAGLLHVLRDGFTLPGLLSSHDRLKKGSYSDALFQIEALLGVPAAVQEMLMQSIGGMIRLFPALPAGMDASFTRLRARGNVLVSASREAGCIGPVLLETQCDGCIAFVNPWPGADVLINGKETHAVDGILRFDAQADMRYELRVKGIPHDL